MVVGEGLQDFVAGGGEMEDDAAAVDGIAGAAEEAGFFAALTELDGGVMAEAEAFGDVGDGYEGGVGGAGDLQQKLMLLGLEASLGGALLAEVEEFAEFVAEVGEWLEGAHSIIVSYCDTYEFGG